MQELNELDLKKLGSKIKFYRVKRNMTQAELGKVLDVSSSTIGMYEQGRRQPPFNILVNISSFFGVDINEFHSKAFTGSNLVMENATNYSTSIIIPVYGSIPAGMPLEAIEDIQGDIDIPVEWTKGDKKFIALKVKGDSMYPKYLDGDTVIIQRQPDCESGQDCACYVNGYEATLKTVIKHIGKIELKPINPNYPPKTYSHPGEVEIVGIVKELRRKP